MEDVVRRQGRPVPPEQTTYRGAGATYEWVLDERSGMWWQRPTGIGIAIAPAAFDPQANAQAAIRYMAARYGPAPGWTTYATAYGRYGREARRTSVWELLRFGWLFVRREGREVVRRWWGR